MQRNTEKMRDKDRGGEVETKKRNHRGREARRQRSTEKERGTEGNTGKERHRKAEADVETKKRNIVIDLYQRRLLTD